MVHAPALGLSYFAEKGCGAFMQCGDSVPVEIEVAMHGGSEKIKLVGSRSHSDARQDELVANLEVWAVRSSYVW